MTFYQICQANLNKYNILREILEKQNVEPKDRGVCKRQKKILLTLQCICLRKTYKFLILCV